MDVGKIVESDLKEVVDNFHDMSLKEELLRGIYENGFQKPLDIQQRALLPCIMGHDVIIQSPPGTGKTTSVLISVLQQIDTSLNKCQALFLAPTRDLALKIQKMVNVLGEFMKIYCSVFIGGTNIHDDVRKLQTESHVVVGTPGCVYDMIVRNSLQPQFIKIFVLVEASKILSDKFDDQIKKVFKSLGDDTQVILLSNQMSTKVLDKSTYYTCNPIHILVKQEELILDAIKQFHVNITKENDTTNGHLSETKDYSGPLMDDGGTIAPVCREMVEHFDDINLKEELLCGNYRYGLEKPTPVQQNTILPCIMRHDVIIQSPPAIKQFYIKINKIKSEHHSETKDSLGSLMDDCEKIESDWKKVVDNFHAMNLKEELLFSIYGCGFGKPSPIQQRAVVPCIMGHDVIIQSPPGTGKITSVLISILQHIDTSLNKCQSLILAPNRDLALKIQKMVNVLGEFMKIYCSVCIGGTNIHDDMRELKTGSHVVVGTPGRVYHMMVRNSLQPQFIKIFVLVEASEILSYKFNDQIKKVFKPLGDDTQVILLSNEMSTKVLDKSTYYTSNPIHILAKPDLRLDAIKQFHVNITKENETKNGHLSETKDYSGPLMDDGENIVADWKEVVHNFDEMNLKEELLGSIYRCGIEEPLPIQQRAILPCIMGHDVIIQSPPGTGKTTSVLISILQQIDTSLNECQALILAPSRKLALQIQKVVIAFGEFMKADCYACIHGINTLDTFPHIVVGTPACVLDLIFKKCLQTKFIKIFVLDKINKLLNQGVKYQINEVFKVLEKNVQVIVLSDPMPDFVFDVSTIFFRNPVRITAEIGFFPDSHRHNP